MSEATDSCRFIYKDLNQPIEARVVDLLSHMSLKEKVGQMTCTENPAASPSTIKDLSIGAILYSFPASCYPTEPASATDWADMVDSLQKAALESHLGFPIIQMCDSIHGHGNVFGATVFPHNIGLGATRQGFILSGWEGIDTVCEPYRADYRHCVLTSINAGVDMNMEPFQYEEYFETLISLIESGEIPMSRIDDAVKRILEVKFITGLFEHPFADRSLLDTVGCKVHRELAREAVRKSLILLKNGKDLEKPFLPLDKNARRILVIGRHADDLGYQCGGWTITKYGTSGRITIGTTILEGIKEAVEEHSEVIYEQNPSSATFEGLEFSFAIVVVGKPAYAESKGYNVELKNPFEGANVINMVAERVPTLVVLISGRPLVLEPELLEKIDALVAAWLPGSQGEGVADVVFGD
ncbi:hypothetical protein CMV_014026 [Castanea mollissima]|uniref:Beta-glucosidase n=1 Tax=Castanea mollissima TaxID=60419 RepID=A0A8J4VHJ6_9ROSI|nr:hypothetical protein CMV_014026 [Castanea mollissima]